MRTYMNMCMCIMQDVNNLCKINKIIILNLLKSMKYIKYV